MIERIKGFCSSATIDVGPLVVYHGMLMAYHGLLITAAIESTAGICICLGLEKSATIYRKFKGEK